jgi:protocatechuate 3,4-dioxygenase beta subunit
MTRIIIPLHLLAILSASLLVGCTRAEAKSGLTSYVRIAGPQEPGERLIVTGHVLSREGKPLGGVVIEAHHTDAHGIYLAEGAHGPNPAVAARLWGRLITAPDGSYRIDTIKPGGYPGDGAPAHIHVHIRDGKSDAWALLEFAGDPNLTPAMIAKDGAGGTFATIRPLERDASGVLHCTRDFRVGVK